MRAFWVKLILLTLAIGHARPSVAEHLARVANTAEAEPDQDHVDEYTSLAEKCGSRGEQEALNYPNATPGMTYCDYGVTFMATCMGLSYKSKFPKRLAECNSGLVCTPPGLDPRKAGGHDFNSCDGQLLQKCGFIKMPDPMSPVCRTGGALREFDHSGTTNGDRWGHVEFYSGINYWSVYKHKRPWPDLSSEIYKALPPSACWIFAPDQPDVDSLMAKYQLYKRGRAIRTVRIARKNAATALAFSTMGINPDLAADYTRPASVLAIAEQNAPLTSIYYYSFYNPTNFKFDTLTMPDNHWTIDELPSNSPLSNSPLPNSPLLNNDGFVLPMLSLDEIKKEIN